MNPTTTAPEQEFDDVVEGGAAQLQGTDSPETQAERESKLSSNHNTTLTHARRALSDARSSNEEESIIACALTLAAVLEKVYRRTWEIENVEERIHLYEEAIMLISVIPHEVQRGHHPIPHPGSLLCITNTVPSSFTYKDVKHDIKLFGIQRTLKTCKSGLSCAMGDRFKYTGQVVDIQRQLYLSREVLSSLPTVDPSRAEACYRLASALRAIYGASEDVVDIQEAVATSQDAVRLCTDEHAEPVYLSELGCSLAKRYHARENNADILLDIDYQRRALHISPIDHPSRHQFLYGLGDALWLHFISTRTLASVEEAITLHCEALKLCKPGHRDRLMVLNGLGIAFSALFRQSANIEHISTAIDYHRETLALRPPGHADRGKSLSNLAGSLRLRFTELGHIADLTTAIKLCEEFYHLYPSGHPLHRWAIDRFANALQYLYHHDGDEALLEKAVRLQREALKMFPIGDVGRSVPLNNLADALRLRYDRHRNLDDLEESIDMLRENLAASPPSSIMQGTFVSNLAIALTRRAEATSSVSDLDEAVGILRHWIETGTPDDNLRSCYLRRLSLAYALRFQLLDQAQDLDTAVQFSRRALSLRPAGHPRRNHSLQDLAYHLRLRFQQSQSQADAAESMQLLEEFQTLHPYGNPQRAQGMREMAFLVLTPGTSFHDVQRGLELVQTFLDDPHRNAQNRLIDAVKVLQLVSMPTVDIHPAQNLRTQLLHTYRMVVRMLPHVAYFGLDIQSRLRVLASAENLASKAALLSMDTLDLRMAVEILEQGRGVFWTQYLRLRTPFDDLPTELAEKLKDVSRQLERGSVDDSQESADGEVQTKADIENAAAERRILGDEFERLVTTARAQPGFDRFMLHDTFAHLTQVADRGHVLILLATDDACRGILIKHLTKEPIQILLPSLHLERLRQLRGLLDNANIKKRFQIEDRGMKRVVPRNAELGANEILAELWNQVMKMVVDILGISMADGRSRPRLFICATGAFAQLPLHASGVYQKKKEVQSCSSYVVTSYTPTLGALLNARRTFRPFDIRAATSLIAAVPKPFQGSPLPCAVDELSLVGNLMRNIYSEDAPDSANQPAHHEFGDAAVGDVMSKLPGVNMLHLACHGRQHPSNPLESGFACSDGTLTVAKLMALNLPNAFFAFLSACETAKGDKAQPDQVIHLAATMLFVGFKSVIGTLWSMGDVDGPKVAKHVYEALYQKDAFTIDPDVIPYALDAAVSELRAKGLHPSRWAPFVHIGM